jgi:hypothetical protein
MPSVAVHKPRVPGAAFGEIRLLAKIVAERIDAKGAMLKNDHACHPHNEECTEGRNPDFRVFECFLGHFSGGNRPRSLYFTAS